jgi:acetoin utilization deacetylase AcuC-like enzyme
MTRSPTVGSTISRGWPAIARRHPWSLRLCVQTNANLCARSRAARRRVGAPVGAVLEGGYHLPSLGASVISMMRALVGDGEAQSVAPEFAYTPRAASYVGQHWELC